MALIIRLFCGAVAYGLTIVEISEWLLVVTRSDRYFGPYNHRLLNNKIA